MCSWWFFFVLIVIVASCLSLKLARAHGLRAKFHWGAPLVLLVLSMVGLELARIAGREHVRVPLFGFLLIGAFVVWAVVRLLRAPAHKQAGPFCPALPQRRWCPTCGNPLPANAPHGICPRC